MNLIVLLLVVLGQTGIFWQGESESEAYYLVDSGVKSILTDRILPQSVLTLFAENGIRIVSMTDVRYLRTSQWEADSVLIGERMEDGAHFYSSYPNHLAHIHLRDPSPLWPIPDRYLVMRQKGDVSLTDSLHIRLHHRFDLARIQTGLQQEGMLEFFPYSWLTGDNAGVIKAWIREPASIFPLSAEEPDASGTTFAVILLFACFGLWLFAYTFMPTYRKSLYRYLVTHSFFASDAAHRRIRLEGAMLTLWALSGAVSGIFVMALTDTFLTEQAEALLAEWFFAPNAVGWFLIGFSASLAWDALMLLWLFSAGYRIPALYLWPRHLHFGIVVVIVAILGGSSLQFMLPAMLWSFPILWLACFHISIFDHSPYMGPIRRRALMMTAIPHLLLLGAFLIQFPKSDLYESILLLLSLG